MVNFKIKKNCVAKLSLVHNLGIFQKKFFLGNWEVVHKNVDMFLKV